MALRSRYCFISVRNYSEVDNRSAEKPSKRRTMRVQLEKRKVIVTLQCVLNLQACPYAQGHSPTVLMVRTRFGVKCCI